MKTKYNKIIEWTITIVLAVPYITLVVFGSALKGISKLLNATQTIIEISLEYMLVLRRELIKELSVKD